MLISDEFPGKYLKEPNLKGKTIKFKIIGVGSGRYRNGDKSCELSLAGTEQIFGLNKGMINQLAAAYGDNTDDWIGESIILYPTTCEYGNDPEYPCVRLKIPPKHDLPKAEEVAAMNDADDVFCPGDDEPPI